MNQTQLSNLHQIAYELSLKRAAEQSGEQFHDKYLKNPRLFRMLMRSDLQLEKGFKAYFKDLASRVPDYINWTSFNFHKASVIDDMIDVDWEGEKLSIKVLLTKGLVHAIAAGGQMTQEDTGIDIGWTEFDSPALDFLNKYSLKLAGDLNDTTLDRIKSGIKLSLGNGESQAEAVARLSDIIDNPARARTIAHTESVRAFTQGRLEVGRQIGANRKQWDATIAACPICAPLDGKIVGIDKSFGDGISEPPAHPNCRCIVNILMPNE